jgi:hypothetical protein
MKRRRTLRDSGLTDEDPLAGVANLFDLAVVLSVGLLVMAFDAFRLQVQDVYNDRTEMTIMKKGPGDELEIVTKKGKLIQAMRVSKIRAQGRGERLGTAYRLEDGTMVYVPD